MMAKKSKSELVEEGKALASEIQMVRSKGPLNFALVLAEDGVAVRFDKVKSPEALFNLVKKADGATSRGTAGTAEMDGKIIVLTCAAGGWEAPPKLGKAFKRHLKVRGLAFKVRLQGAVVEEDDGEDDPGTEGGTGSTPEAPESPPDTTGVPRPGSPPNPDNGLKDKLQKAFEKIRPRLLDALASCPPDYKSKLSGPATVFAKAMKEEKYETALAALGLLRKALVAAPTENELAEQLKEADDATKLAGMADLIDGLLARKGGDGDFGKTIKPRLREARTKLKSALAATPAPDGSTLEALRKIKTQLDQAFLADLKSEGHGPQRHEGDVTKAQLADRAMYKKDPMTGTTSDGAHPGKTHKCGKVATRITDPGVYVDADETIRALPGFKTLKDDPVTVSEGRFEIEIPIEDALGGKFASHVEGVRVLGSNKHPTGTEDVDFTGGTVIAVYDRAPDGTVTLLTLYPNPKP